MIEASTFSQTRLTACVHLDVGRKLPVNSSQARFWPTVLSVVCLSVCNVLYCGKTVRPSQKVSEGVNRKHRVKKFIFLVAAIFLLPVSYGRPPLALAGFLVLFGHGFLCRNFTDRRDIWHEASPIYHAGSLEIWGVIPPGMVKLWP